MPTSPCGVRWRVSLPPALMQWTDAGLAISIAGLVADSDGEQAQLARAITQRMAICVRCISINRHAFVNKLKLILLSSFIDG